MTSSHVHLKLETVHGKPFVIRYADELAEFFFRTNLSYLYDEWAQADADPNRITTGDITAINQTMAARSSHKHWSLFSQAADDLPGLLAIDRTWDLFGMDDAEWADNEVESKVGALLEATMGPYRGGAVVTKVLHVKRPALIPVCDSVVAQVLGTALWDSSDWASVRDLVVHLRRQGRVNLSGLRSIQKRLTAAGFERTTVRVLDSILWVSGLTAGPYAVFREWVEKAYG